MDLFAWEQNFPRISLSIIKIQTKHFAFRQKVVVSSSGCKSGIRLTQILSILQDDMEHSKKKTTSLQILGMAEIVNITTHTNWHLTEILPEVAAWSSLKII